MKNLNYKIILGVISTILLLGSHPLFAEEICEKDQKNTQDALSKWMNAIVDRAPQETIDADATAYQAAQSALYICAKAQSAPKK